MALRTIGTATTAGFGTGDEDVLSKEVTVEVTTDVVKKDGNGVVLGYVLGNEVKNVRETKYGTVTELDTATLTGGEIRKTLSASNEDFVKVTTETRALVAAT